MKANSGWARFLCAALLCGSLLLGSLSPSLAAGSSSGKDKSASSKTSSESQSDSKKSAEEKAFPVDPTVESSLITPPEAIKKARDLTAEEKESVIAALRELYISYAQKDLPSVIKLIKTYIENSAEDYAAKHPQDKEAAAKIRDAYQAFHGDIFRHKDYELETFSPEFADYAAYEDGSVEVISPVPIISTKSMNFEDSKGDIYLVRLRLGRFILKPSKEGWVITEMDLF